MSMIEDLRLFVSICDRGSLSAAARHARISPSTVSRRIAALEDAFGTKLLSKSTRRLAVTAAGRTLADGGRTIIQQLDDLRAELSEAESQPHGLLRISASTGFGGRYIAPLMGEFRRLYPGISVNLQLDNNVVDLVADDADIAIRVGVLPPSQLRHVLLGRLHRIACASPAYLAQHPSLRRPEDLSAHECIGVTAASQTSSAWRFLDTPRRIDARLTVSSHEAAAAAAVAGAGIAHLPFWLVREELERGDLERVLAKFEVPEAGGVHLLWHERPPARVRAFVAFLRQHIRAEDLSPTGTI